jgi:penicillin-binding protein 1C
MGNFTGETVIGKTGSSIPAAIVRDALLFLQGSGRPSSGTPSFNRSQNNSPDFAQPEKWKPGQVCALSGMSPTPACFSVVTEFLVPGEESAPCTWHQVSASGVSAVVYPAEYQSWLSLSSRRQGEVDYNSRPLEIITPREGFVFLRSPGIGRDEIPVEVIGGTENELEVRYDNAAFGQKRPFTFYLPSTPGMHILRVRNSDEEAEIRFSVE